MYDPRVPTRAALIDLCSRGVVDVTLWRDRDSADAQRQLGEVRALLAAGCAYTPASDPASDDRSIWIEVSFPGFNAFESFEGPSDEAAFDTALFYIPTDERLRSSNGRDWY
jgi:hypothetical protein